MLNLHYGTGLVSGDEKRQGHRRRPWLLSRCRSRLVRCIGLLLAVAASGVPAEAVTDRPSVMVTRVDDPITPVIEDHLDGMVDVAQEDGHVALIVELDTPGGLDSAMRRIVQAFLGARVPVVVHVSPPGARAASAGALIAWSANVVAMAPGTTIGAATPVDLEGGEVGDKIVNDAAAFARAVAEERGRNVDVAATAVTEGRALSDTEAVAEGVADVIVSGRTALLDTLDGREVTLAGGTTVVLRTAGAVVEEKGLSALRRVLQRLADPNLAFLFMSVGTLGLVYELATPGLGLAGGVGLVLILLSLFSLAVLPIDAVGFLFLALAGVLFVAELFAPGVGLAGGLGAVALALSGVFLFPDDLPGLSLSLSAVVPTVAVVGMAVVGAGRLALRARASPPATGMGTVVGRELHVGQASGHAGQAMVDGAWWNVRSSQPLHTGDRVRVRAVEGLDLVVEPLTPKERKAGHE